jgi:hypothetical protein
MIRREIARRDEANSHPWAPERVILDGGPEDAAKLADVEARYPGKAIVTRVIVNSPLRHAAIPGASEDDDSWKSASIDGGLRSAPAIVWRTCAARSKLLQICNTRGGCGCGEIPTSNTPGAARLM